MKITDTQLHIKSIIGVYKGKIPPSSPKCKSRHSDCFVYVLSGEAEYIFKNRTYLASSGDIIYLSADSVYSINVTDENYAFIYVDFVFENDKNTVFKNGIYKSKSLLLLKSNFENLYRLWNMGGFADKIYCDSLVYEIYAQVVKSYFSQLIPHERRKQIECVAEYIIQNLHDCDLTVSNISRKCNISEVHFRRLFSCVYHVSPIRFIKLARINKAKELLLSETCSISEIAENCGFQNHYYFSKAFKTETNMTPSDFRKFYATNH
ncbi:MAG: helix-turn-helix domain-containing protein [Acutalibacteraceae bacterium]|nr:helix-turn-helix domain-containing protein [Acutalibacteraceae bacterium]